MKRTSRIRCWILCASTAIVMLGLMAAGSSASAQPAPPTKAQWQADIAHVREPGAGCYRASYPAMTWQASRCVSAPRVPLVPRPLQRPARHAGPALVGFNTDFSAQVSGSITQATGSFQDVTPGITEQGIVLNTGVVAANAFTLQLNSQFFSGSPACAGGSPSCEAWQQFVYAYNTPSTSFLFMQYWLINYGPSCPSGWSKYDKAPNDCFTNSSTAEVSTLAASQLATAELSGSAQAGGDDGVLLSAGSGQATLVTRGDGVLDLAQHWNTTEWGVYGDAFGNEAVFGPGTTLQAVTAVTSTDYAAPTCVEEGFTGETNNLNLTSTPALSTGSTPTIASRQTNGTTGTPSCSAAAGALPPPTNYEAAFQASTGSLWTVGASDANLNMDIMAGTSPSIAALSGGGYEIAFQASTGFLWTVGTAGDTNWGLGMMKGTSPAITALSSNGYEVAFQANTGNLWSAGTAGIVNWNLGMMAGTSPAITTLTNGAYEMAFQSNVGQLWSAGKSGSINWTLGMMAGTSPAITGMTNGTYEMAFQSNNGQLWSRNSTGNSWINWTLGMMPGTSPAIVGLSNGTYEMAMQSNNGQLWSRNSVGANGINWTLGMMKGTSPAIAALSNGTYEMAFQSIGGQLWTRNSTGINGIDWGLDMASGTSPSVTR